MKKIAKILLIVVFCVCLAAGLASCAKNYTIDFRTNCEVSVATMKAKEGEEVVLPSIERSGYEFEGWFENESFSGSSVKKITLSKNTTLYAKWSKLYTISLDADGGALSVKTLSAKAGANLTDLLKNFVPVKSGLLFGGWFKGGKEVSGNMPSSDLSLKAKYKAEYTVEIHTRKLDSEEFEVTTEKGYAFVGERVELTNEYEGLEEIDQASSVTSLTISATSSENVFRRYFDRKNVIVHFRAEETAGGSDNVKRYDVKYGEKIIVPVDCFEKKGYWLVGWTDGKNVYTTGKRTFNDKTGEAPSEITVSENTVFTAVWLKGYADAFGGNDYIFVREDEPGLAYLSRGGFFFKGSYREKINRFIFELDNEDRDVVLDGKLLDGGLFTYSIVYRSEQIKERYLYSVADGVNKKVQIVIDDYNGIKYTDGDNVSSGYFVTDEGRYVATFESGVLGGKTLVMLFDSLEGTDDNGNAETVNIFRVRNEEEYKLSKLYRGVVRNGSLTHYNDGYYTLTFNGYGTVSYSYYGNGSFVTVNYYCSLDGDEITLTDSDGKIVFTAKTIEILNSGCYLVYNETLDGSFESENGDVLTLDGTCNATLVKGETTVTGYYETTQSVFKGVIVTVTSSGNTYKCLLKEKENSSGGEIISGDGGTSAGEEKAEYVLLLKAKNYKEYYYKDETDIYYAPLFVIDDEEEGSASLYGYTAKNGFVLVSSGTYTSDAETGRTVYVAARFYSYTEEAKNIIKTPLDASKVTSFECYLGSSSVRQVSYDIAYWFGYTTSEGKHNAGKVYISENGEKLTLVADLAVYNSERENIYGVYTNDNNVLTVNSAAGTRYFEINEENGSFVRLTGELFTANRYLPDGRIDLNETLVADGKGGAVYSVKGKQDVIGSLETKSGASKFGSVVYKFTSDDESVSFEFVRLSASSLNVFAIYDKTYDATYSMDSATLSPDGFGYRASYNDGNGENIEGVYYLESEICIRMVIDGKVRYFDLDLENYMFTVRGDEYGVYVNTENGFVDYDLFFELDGYSSIKTFTTDDGGNRLYNWEGIYEKIGDRIFFTRKNGAETIKGEYALGDGKYIFGGVTYGELIVLNKRVSVSFVNTLNWSILILDDAGGATRIDKDGSSQKGRYKLITEKLLYFKGDNDESRIYKYDMEAGTADPVDLKGMAYYTENLDSLLFDKGGFVLDNGADTYYYNVENGVATIYIREENAANANEYGFVEKEFGRFESEKTFGGKNYKANNGFEISFKRKEEGEELYPVYFRGSKQSLGTIRFSPNGNAEFSVSGTIEIAGSRGSATFRRETDKDGNSRIYIIAGVYQIDLAVYYRGENERGESLSEYEVTSLRQVIYAPAYKYLDNYYRYYVNYGARYASSYTNNVGTLTVTYNYDENGDEVSEEISASFGEGSFIYDANGNVLTMNNPSFTTNANKNTYLVEFVGDDGFTYKAKFRLVYHSAYRSTYGYYVDYVSRTETLSAENGYTVEVDRIIGSDGESSLFGGFRTVKLIKDGTEIPCSGAIISSDKTAIRYVSRTYDENKKITASVFYSIAFVVNGKTEIGEENKKALSTFKSASVTEEVVALSLTEDGKTFIEADEEGNVILLTAGEKVYLINSTEYNAETGVYTIKSSAATFTFKLSADKKTIKDFTETNG